jgi:DNA-binding response OmpR family regulator
MNQQRILVVDDDPMFHKLLGYALKSEDYLLSFASNAEGAKEELGNNHKDILAIILDWEMPGMSGVDLLKWMKREEDYKDIPVIMLTGRSSPDEIKSGINAGAFYYVTKPFQKDFLNSVLSAAIADRQNLLHLANELEKVRNPLESLMQGEFKFKTIQEAQKLSVFIANTSPNSRECLIICELFNNAIEHGNLGISYDEKSNLVDSNGLFEEIDRRLELPEYKDRWATLHFDKNEDRILLTLIDEGDGFDFQKYLHFDEDRVFDNHGRGIAMANSMLDITYLGKGNRVVINIPLGAPTQNMD